MRTHTIPRKPKILDWAQIPVLPIDHLLWSPQVDIEAQARICYDEHALYVHMEAKESLIRAENFGPLDAPCEDSCLEFFFCPISGDNRYFNIEFNPNCCLYLGFGSGISDLIRLIPPSQELLSPKAVKTTDGWEITYQVPVSFIRQFFPDFAPTPGTPIRGNFYKCGDLTVQEHYLSWNMVTSPTRGFHRPCDFGLLIFE